MFDELFCGSVHGTSDDVESGLSAVWSEFKESLDDFWMIVTLSNTKRGDSLDDFDSIGTVVVVVLICCWCS